MAIALTLEQTAPRQMNNLPMTAQDLKVDQITSDYQDQKILDYGIPESFTIQSVDSCYRLQDGLLIDNNYHAAIEALIIATVHYIDHTMPIGFTDCKTVTTSDVNYIRRLGYIPDISDYGKALCDAIGRSLVKA